MNIELNPRGLVKCFIYLYIFAVVLANNTGDIIVKISRVALVGVFFLYFLFKKNKKANMSFYILWGLLFLIYNACRVPYAMDTRLAHDYTLTLMYVVIIDCIICFYMKDNDITEGIFKIIILFAIIQSLKVYLTDGFLVFLNSRKTLNLSANNIGFNNAMAVVFSYYFIKKAEKKGSKRLYTIFLILSALFMILSASRKALLFAGIPIILYNALSTKNSAIFIRNILLIAAAVIIAWTALMKVNFLYDLVGNRMESMLQGFSGNETDGSTETRLRLIEWGIEWWKDNPVFGYGMYNYSALMAKYNPWSAIAYYAHNNYIELLVDSGLIGTIWYYFLYFIMLIRGIRLLKYKDPVSTMMFGILITFVVNDYGMVTYNLPVNQVILVVCYIDFFVRNKNRVKGLVGRRK